MNSFRSWNDILIICEYLVYTVVCEGFESIVFPTERHVACGWRRLRDVVRANYRRGRNGRLRLAPHAHAPCEIHSRFLLCTTGSHRHHLLHVDDSEPHGLRLAPLHAPPLPGLPVGHAVHPQAYQELLDCYHHLRSSCYCHQIRLQVPFYQVCCYKNVNVVIGVACAIPLLDP